MYYNRITFVFTGSAHPGEIPSHCAPAAGGFPPANLPASKQSGIPTALFAEKNGKLVKCQELFNS